MHAKTLENACLFIELRAFSTAFACRSIDRHAKPAENACRSIERHAKRTEIERSAFAAAFDKEEEHEKKIIRKSAD